MEMVADPSSLGWDSEQYLRFIDRLDRTPTLARTEIGMKMIRTFEAMVESHSRRSFGVMDAETGARLMVLYDYDPAPVVDLSDKSFAARLAAYTALRHIHAVEAQLDADAGTRGVGIVHYPTEGRRYNFALLEGAAPHLSRDLRESLEHEFGVFTGTSVVPRSAAPNT